jgi:hypothetical protein
MCIEPSTPQDQLSPKLIISPSKKKSHTHQQVLIMEGGDEEMEVDLLLHNMMMNQHKQKVTRS